jgi:tRNA-specific 2-thiouridylase
MSREKTKVVIAMSGGVDSSVAAALLVEQGYDVTGMMLRLWSEPGSEYANRCCTPDAMALAKQVSSILSIPFYVIDAKEIFRNIVVDYFLDGYTQGITPNPCLVCNRRIRWKYLLERAQISGAEYFATGHYARLEKIKNNPIRLYQGVDKEKDQSYVLGNLNQAQLQRTLFPLGKYKKKEVRVLANKFNLPVSTIKDSQDLCFLAGSDYQSFLKRHAPATEKTGPITNTSGKILGKHSGLAFYTIGQRKGIGISSPEPLYVIEKNMKKNALIVGKIDELGQDKLTASKVNWVSGVPPGKPFQAMLKIRYKSPLVPAKVTLLNDNTFQAKFDRLLRDITPGQAAVIYDGEEVIASGIIDSTPSLIEVHTITKPIVIKA